MWFPDKKIETGVMLDIGKVCYFDAGEFILNTYPSKYEHLENLMPIESMYEGTGDVRLCAYENGLPVYEVNDGQNIYVFDAKSGVKISARDSW